MKKRNLLSLVILFLTFCGFLLYLFSQILNIGVSLRESHPYVEYTFYILCGIAIFYFIIRPFTLVLFSPSYTLYHLKEKTAKEKHRIMIQNHHRLHKIAKQLISKKLIKPVSIEKLQVELTQKYDSLLDSYTHLKSTVNSVIEEDIKNDIRKTIITTAKDTMYLTTLSQNTLVDMLIVVVNNFRMVKKIVIRCGFRPSFFRLLKLYINVIISSFIAEGAESVDMGSLLGGGLKGVAKPLIGAVVDGALNGFFMLRTGFITKKYIFQEINDQNELNILHSAMLEAALAFPELAIHSVVKPMVDALKGTIITPTKGIIKRVFSNKSISAELEGIEEES